MGEGAQGSQDGDALDDNKYENDVAGKDAVAPDVMKIYIENEIEDQNYIPHVNVNVTSDDEVKTDGSTEKLSQRLQ